MDRNNITILVKRATVFAGIVSSSLEKEDYRRALSCARIVSAALETVYRLSIGVKIERDGESNENVEHSTREQEDAPTWDDPEWEC